MLNGKQKQYRKKTFKTVKRPNNTLLIKNIKKTVKAVVRSSIKRKMEKKSSSSDPIPYLFNTTATGNSVMSNPVPLNYTMVIPQGVEDGDRIGQSVNGTRVTLKMIMVAPPTSGSAILQVFIGKVRRFPTILPNAVELATIFDAGGTTAPADGSYGSLIRSINKEVWNITYYKQFKLALANSTNYANNDFKAYQKISIDLTKQLGGICKYSTDNNNEPTNKHLYMFCNWVNPASGLLSAVPPKLTYYVDYEYADM